MIIRELALAGKSIQNNISVGFKLPDSQKSQMQLSLTTHFFQKYFKRFFALPETLRNETNLPENTPDNNSPPGEADLPSPVMIRIQQPLRSNPIIDKYSQPNN